MPYTSKGRLLAHGEVYGLILNELRHAPGTCREIADRLELAPWGSHIAAQYLSAAFKRGDVTRTGTRGRAYAGGYVYALPLDKTKEGSR